MKLKSVLAIIILGLVCVSVAAAASFSIVTPAKAGNNDMVPGDYKVSLKGSVAVIENADTYKSFTVIVKTEDSATKFDRTSVVISKKDGQNRIEAIEMGGSSTRLVIE